MNEKIIVFSTEWFKKHNKILCRIANSWIGNRVFNFRGMGHYLEKEIVDITPNSVAEHLQGNEFRRHFFGRNEYALRLQKVFYPIWITFHIWDIITRPIPQLNLGFDTLTAYSLPGTTVSGNARRASVNETFATIRAGDGNASNYDSGQYGITTQINGSATTNQFAVLTRGIFLFDTSSLTSGAIISAAILSLKTSAIGTAQGNGFEIDIVAATPASDTVLANSDYAQLGSTPFSSIAYASFVIDNYADFTLDANGQNNISKTGISKFGSRLNWDTDNSFGGTWASSGYSGANFYDGATAGTASDPKLVVTYTNTSFSPSASPSLSPSLSPSFSPSASPSVSPSASISPSLSPSASISPSLSPSFSPSISPSTSISPSISPSMMPDKHTSTYTAPTKNSSSFSLPSKNTSTYTSPNKN
jgi:hypothetical protein